MTEWSPDTCECVIVFSETAKDTFSPVQIKKRCKFHENIKDDREHFNTVFGENQKKNKGIAVIVQLEGSKGFTPETVQWRMDDARNVYYKIKDSLPLAKDQKDVTDELAKIDLKLKIE